jgi:hypothetical protein
VLRKGYTCQKRTSHHDHNTILGGRLGIDRVGAMLYLLEGQVLTIISLARIVWIWSSLPEASPQWRLLPGFLVPQR